MEVETTDSIINRGSYGKIYDVGNNWVIKKTGDYIDQPETLKEIVVSIYSDHLHLLKLQYEHITLSPDTKSSTIDCSLQFPRFPHDVFQWIYSLRNTVNAFHLKVDALYTYIIPQLSSVLQYIHSHGLIHVDLKSSNVLIDENRKQVVLIDFGLMVSATTNQMIHGTEPFSPPESIVDVFMEGDGTDGVESDEIRYSNENDDSSSSKIRHGQGTITCAFDYWSLGCVIMDILFSFETNAVTQQFIPEEERVSVWLRRLRHEPTQTKLLQYAQQVYQDDGNVLMLFLLKIVKNLLVHDPKNRWNANQLIEFYQFAHVQVSMENPMSPNLPPTLLPTVQNMVLTLYFAYFNDNARRNTLITNIYQVCKRILHRYPHFNSKNTFLLACHIIDKYCALTKTSYKFTTKMQNIYYSAIVLAIYLNSTWTEDVDPIIEIGLLIKYHMVEQNHPWIRHVLETLQYDIYIPTALYYILKSTTLTYNEIELRLFHEIMLDQTEYSQTLLCNTYLQHVISKHQSRRRYTDGSV